MSPVKSSYSRVRVFKGCGLALGPAVWLTRRQQRITDTRKRKAEEEPEEHSLNKPKKIFSRLDHKYHGISISPVYPNPCWLWREEALIIDNMCIDLCKKLATVSVNIDDYCDAATCQELPFPFLGEAPTRFKLDQDSRFSFYGREKFREVYLAVKSMGYQQTRMYFFHGTLGAGKSHLLAAPTCLLIREGAKVVYLPDCRALLRNSLEYLRTALRLTFDEDEDASEALDDAKTIEELEEFCTDAASEFRLLFIIDQANALDPEDEAADRLSLIAKRGARTLIDKITSGHLKFASSGGNYQHTWHDMYRETGEKRLRLYGGLTDVSSH